MTIKTEIAALADDAFLAAIAAELAELHQQLGQPEPPEGPTTETRLSVGFATADSVGDWSGREADVAEALNGAIERLYAAADYRHVGGGIWYTQYDAGAPAWREYQDAARGAIEDWLSRSWDRFCDDPYGILD